MGEIMEVAWFAILRNDHRANACSGIGEILDSGTSTNTLKNIPDVPVSVPWAHKGSVFMRLTDHPTLNPLDTLGEMLAQGSRVATTRWTKGCLAWIPLAVRWCITRSHPPRRANVLPVLLGVFVLSGCVHAENLLTLYERALRSEPMILAAREDLDAAREGVLLAKARLSPSVDLSVSLKHTSDDVWRTVTEGKFVTVPADGDKDNPDGGKDDSGGGKDDSGGGKDNPDGGKDDSDGGKDDSGGGKDDSGGGKDDSGGGKDDSGGGKDDSGGGKDDSGGGKDEPTVGKDKPKVKLVRYRRTRRTRTKHDRKAFTVRLVQPLFRRDRSIAVSQASEQVRQAESDYVREQQALILKLVNAYFDVLSARKRLSFIHDEREAIRHRLEQARDRFDAGWSTIIDVYEGEARLKQYDSTDISAKGDLDKAMEAMHRIVQDASPVLDDLGEFRPVPPSPASLDDWIVMALKRSPKMVSMRAANDVARKEIDRQRAKHYPTLDLVASIEGDKDSSKNLSKSLELKLAVPLFAGGSFSAKVRQARHRFISMQEKLENVRREVTENVSNAYHKVHVSINRMMMLKSTVEASENALKAVEAGFMGGTRTLVAVLDSQRALFRARYDYAQSRYNYVLSTIRLLGAAGVLTVDDLEHVNDWLAKGTSEKLAGPEFRDIQVSELATNSEY